MKRLLVNARCLILVICLATSEKYAAADVPEPLQQRQQQLRAPLFEDKVVDHIFAAAKVTEKTVTKDKLEKAVEALDEL